MTKKQITLRLPDEVYGQLQQESERKGISTHEFIMFILSYYLEHKPKDIV